MSKLKIALGSDHAGLELKNKLKNKLGMDGYQVQDFGTNTSESMDYPDIAHPLSHSVEIKENILGILLCGSGNGVAMTANKHTGIRAALCWLPELGSLAREHNDANILVLPARFIDEKTAFLITDSFLHAKFEGGRHAKRVDKICI